MAKRIISRSAHPQPLSCTEPPLNVDAIPYQPAQTNTISPIVEEHEETHVNNAEAILTGSHRESTPLEHENTPQPHLTEPSYVPVNVTSHFTTRLPKLTLPTFSGNPYVADNLGFLFCCCTL